MKASGLSTPRGCWLSMQIQTTPLFVRLDPTPESRSILSASITSIAVTELSMARASRAFARHGAGRALQRDGLWFLKAPARSGSASFLLHPALLDSAFQLLGAALAGTGTNDLFVPVAIESLSVQRAGCLSASARAQVRPAATFAPESYIADLTLTDDSGSLIAELSGLGMKRVQREALLRSLTRDQLFYEVVWRKSRDAQTLSVSEASGAVRVALCPAGSLGDEIESHLRANLVVRPGKAFQWVSAERMELAPGELSDFRRFAQDLSAAHGSSPLEIVFLWGIDVLPRRGTFARLWRLAAPCSGA